MPILAPPSGLNPQTSVADLASEVIAETSLGIAFGHSDPSQRLNPRADLASKNGSKNGGARQRSDGAVWVCPAEYTGPAEGGGEVKTSRNRVGSGLNRLPI